MNRRTAAAVVVVVVVGIVVVVALRKPNRAPADSAGRRVAAEVGGVGSRASGGHVVPPRFTPAPAGPRRLLGGPRDPMAWMIQQHDKGVRQRRDDFVAAAKLDAAEAAKYDALVQQMNERFEAEIAPKIQAAIAEQDPVRRARLGTLATEEGLVKFAKEMTARSAELGPSPPDPLMMLDYLNAKTFGSLITAFGKKDEDETPEEKAAVKAKLAELKERRLKQIEAETGRRPPSE